MRKNKSKEELTPTLVRHLNLIEGWSLARIGRLFGISRERVRQIRNEGLDRKLSVSHSKN